MEFRPILFEITENQIWKFLAINLRTNTSTIGLTSHLDNFIKNSISHITNDPKVGPLGTTNFKEKKPTNEAKWSRNSGS